MSDERTREELLADITMLRESVEIHRNYEDKWRKWAAIFFLAMIGIVFVAVVAIIILVAEAAKTADPELSQPIDALCSARAKQRQRQEQQDE